LPLIPSFHEVSLPLSLAFGSSGGPLRRTEIVALASGRESRNARWAHSRRRFDVGQAVRSRADLYGLVAFFEARKGRLFGFRFRDPLDSRSGSPAAAITPLDQPLGSGDGETAAFQLVKHYGDDDPAPRPILKPVAGTVRVAIDGVEADEGADFTLDPATGIVTFLSVPGEGAEVTAGFEFDLPVRFDADEITVNFAAFEAGDIPSVPILELLA